MILSVATEGVVPIQMDMTPRAGQLLFAADLSDGRAYNVQRRIVVAVEFLQLRLQIGEARLETEPEPVQDREIGLVDAFLLH